MRSKGDDTKEKRNREKLRDLLERERRDSGQSKGDGTGDKRKREKLTKEKENMMVDCWVHTGLKNGVFRLFSKRNNNQSS